MLGRCPEVPDAIFVGWLWEPYADGGPAFILYATWAEGRQQIEATWENGVPQVSL